MPIKDPIKLKEYRRNYRKRNLEKVKANISDWKKANPNYMKEYLGNYQREYNLRTKYKLSLDQYNLMLADQGGVCAVCGKPPTTRPLDVDHCHSSDRVRGLLCNACNMALGQLKDNPENVRRLLQYILRFKEPESGS